MHAKSHLLYHPIFLLSLVVLALNDHVLKGLYHNWLTGKISDFAGLIVLPVFIAFLFPKLRKWTCLISASFFIFWKTEASNDFVDWLNSNGHFSFYRVIDYSDFIALLILPLSWKLVNQNNPNSLRLRKTGSYAIGLISFLVLTATTMPLTQTFEPEGTIYIGQKYKLKVPKDTVLTRIEQLGYTYERYGDRYVINDIVVPEIQEGHKYRIKPDTILELKFYFLDFPYQPTKKQDALGAQFLCVEEVKFSEINTITNWRVLKRYSKIYDEFTKDLFAKEVTKK